MPRSNESVFRHRATLPPPQLRLPRVLRMRVGAQARSELRTQEVGNVPGRRRLLRHSRLQVVHVVREGRPARPVLAEGLPPQVSRQFAV